MAKFYFFAVFIFIVTTQFVIGQGWRSQLYPSNWTPGYKNANGYFLHDFSYAGYQMGEKVIPAVVPGNIYNVSLSPYNADKTGALDATVAIQKAIDDAGLAGGGVVYFPAGTYKIQNPDTTKDYVLWVKKNKVVLRGAGADLTKIYCATTYLRAKSVIKIHPQNGGSWFGRITTPVKLTKDILEPTKNIPVSTVTNFKVGDYIVIHANVTTGLVQEYGMQTFWVEPARIQGPAYYRKITMIDPVNNILVIDIPTRYKLKIRDGAEVYKVGTPISEVGVENLSIGNKQNTRTNGWGSSDYETWGTGAYEVEGSFLLDFKFALNCWAKNVSTYRPLDNASNFHMVSNGLRLFQSRGVTVSNCHFSHPQYEGGGGNGYGFRIEASDNLLSECTSTSTRHSYSFLRMYTTGNVLYKCSSFNPQLPTDFHMYLSSANLLDNVTLDKDYINARVRPYESPNQHGISSTECVVWNVKCTAAYPNQSHFVVVTRQFGVGYVIGTQGLVTNVSTTPTIDATVETAPEDFVEGKGLGATLLPQSLYLDQLQKRLALTPVEEILEETSFIISPNPASKNFRITASSEIFGIVITDQLTREISFTIEDKISDMISLNVEGQPAGIYFIKIFTREGTVVKKLIINP